MSKTRRRVRMFKAETLWNIGRSRKTASRCRSVRSIRPTTMIAMTVTPTCRRGLRLRQGPLADSLGGRTALAIPLSKLREAARLPRTALAKSLNEARLFGLKTAFLCHSHQAATFVVGFVRLLSDAGWNVYVDWRDASMPSEPNRETARSIKERVEAANYFLFLATPNSVSSRWCPWEIGYAD